MGKEGRGGAGDGRGERDTGVYVAPRVSQRPRVSVLIPKYSSGQAPPGGMKA
jgi:hypothetical protein